MFIQLRGKPRPSGRGGIARQAKPAPFPHLLLSVRYSVKLPSIKREKPAFRWFRILCDPFPAFDVMQADPVF